MPARPDFVYVYGSVNTESSLIYRSGATVADYLSQAGMGTIIGAWQTVYIATAIPCGALLDRLGPRRCIIIAGCSCCGSLRASSLGRPLAVLGAACFRSVLAVGSSVYFLWISRYSGFRLTCVFCRVWFYENQMKRKVPSLALSSGAGLGNGAGALSHRVLRQLRRQRQPHRSLHLAGPKRVLLARSRQRRRFRRDALEEIHNQGI